MESPVPSLPMAISISIYQMELSLMPDIRWVLPVLLALSGHKDHKDHKVQPDRRESMGQRVQQVRKD